MNLDHEAFCLADPIFYDAPSAVSVDGNRATVDNDVDAGPNEVAGSLLRAIDRPVPTTWRTSTAGVWTVLHPATSGQGTDVNDDGPCLPAQGWKIHVSATPDNAVRILEQVWDDCIAHGICFKFLGTQTAFLAQNAKYANRSGSGKFITIYPVDEVELERTVRRLGETLRGEVGPYILSDLRWEDGPLYVRYGGFIHRECRNDDGELVPAIENPDGELVPDVREPQFLPPSWVELPAFLAEATEPASGTNDEPLPYEIREALHFSNGGGVYLATDPATGRDVVLKEARPWAGLDGNGADAVARLDREHDILEALAGLDCVPAVHDRRTVWEHHFLVEEHLDGPILADELAQRHPLISSEPDADAIVAYTSWALSVLAAIDRALTAVHDRGIVIGDLHPRNVIVRPDGRIGLIDFELGHRAGDDFTRSMGANGFVAPDDRTGFAIDRFALGALRLALFLPYTELLSWEPAKVDELIGAIELRFPVPPGYGDDVRRDLGEPAADDSVAGPDWRTAIWPRQGLPRWDALRTSMTAAINASATPERDDRLFPGDPAQFPNGGVAIAHGAAGVIWALHETGAGVDPDHLDWLLRAVERHDDLPTGFYDGLTGIAYVLDVCGRRDDALDVLARSFGQSIDADDLSLYSGAAGAGLALLHFADVTDDDRYLELAGQLASHGATQLEQRPELHRAAGLLRGWTGLALLALRLHERTGAPELIDLAERALRADLDRCVWSASGTLQVDDGWRVLPYLEVGSAGIGLVLDELLVHRPDEALLTMQDGIRRAATGDVVIQSGLFNGRAGLLLYLQSLSSVPSRAVQAHLTAMAWHAVPFGGDVAFVGDQLARLSMDLATGSAGVLLALGSALGGRPLSLPFLRSAPRPIGDDDPPSSPVSPAQPRQLERR